ncbi:hypothetical protein JW887_04910 [Candidatus Dojkabacteria bacterium]|nr:hypothetical protein [Candidatus Dojkabacteria bacterium]
MNSCYDAILPPFVCYNNIITRDIVSMKVFFTCSTTKFEQRYPIYKKITSFIEKEGHILSDVWLDEALLNIRKNTFKDPDVLYKRKYEAIMNSDLVIAEGTYKSFTVGHQISIALSKSIPTLIIYHKRNGDKEKYYVAGINSPFLTKKRYTTISEAYKIIKSFFSIYSGRKKRHRFQLVLNQDENKFLDVLMQKEGLTKTDVIRNLIHSEMNRNEDSI